MYKITWIRWKLYLYEIFVYLYLYDPYEILLPKMEDYA